MKPKQVYEKELIERKFAKTSFKRRFVLAS